MEIFDALKLSLTGLATGKLAYAGVAGGQNYSAGLHPEGFWGGSHSVLVTAGFVDVVPAGLLAVVAPEGFEPFTGQGDGAITGNYGERSQPTQPSLLQVLGLSRVERILLANAVEVGAVVGAVNGASFGAATVATGLSHGEKQQRAQD